MAFDADLFFMGLDEIMDSNPLPGNCEGLEPVADHDEDEEDVIQ